MKTTTRVMIEVEHESYEELNETLKYVVEQIDDGFSSGFDEHFYENGGSYKYEVRDSDIYGDNEKLDAAVERAAERLEWKQNRNYKLAAARS